MAINYLHRGKVFGVALDASDDPWTLQLKLAFTRAEYNGATGLHEDPYDAMVPELVRYGVPIEPIGKFPVPSWLSPRPRASDAHLVTKENMEAFVAGGGLLKLSNQLKSFVKENVFPKPPIMLGIDHCATGGVVSALSDELGPENLSVVVLDQHFDGLPLSLRMEPHPMISLGNPTGPVASSSDFFDDDEYCCGNFWKHLIDAGVVLPRNLLFLGVADYPGVKATPGWERFRKNYLDLEARGCNFFPLTEFQGRYLKRLQGFIQHKVTAPNVYVSLDLDVGAYRCVHAARYMDRMGVEREAIMDVARTIGNSSRSGKFRLAGFDVMECNVHFLGLETGDGTKDDTISTALDFIGELLLCRRGAEAGDENQGGGRRRKADRKQRAAE